MDATEVVELLVKSIQEGKIPCKYDEEGRPVLILRR